MPLSNPADPLREAPVADLVVVLLKQFRRLLAERDIHLTTEAMRQLGAAAASHQAPDAPRRRLIAALDALVGESLAELQTRFGLRFAEALATDMNAIGGWETTAEFLEIANHKSNAELRISSGAALLALLDDVRYADILLAVIEADGGADDADALFARRALAHATHIPMTAADWEGQVRQALATRAREAGDAP